MPISSVRVVLLTAWLTSLVLGLAYAAAGPTKISVYGAVGNGNVNAIVQKNGNYILYSTVKSTVKNGKVIFGKPTIWRGIVPSQEKGWLSVYDLQKDD